MNIKDETTMMVQTLATLDSAAQADFMTQTLARFQSILNDHVHGPLDDPANPDAVADPTVDPRNIFFTVLMLDKDTLLANLDGKFARFINGKWLMAMDLFVKLLPLHASAASLREGLADVTLTQMLSGEKILADAPLADDIALVQKTLLDMASGTDRKQVYLAQFAALL